MNTYNSVSMACVKYENMVWGWGWISEAWVGVLQSQENPELHIKKQPDAYFHSKKDKQ